MRSYYLEQSISYSPARLKMGWLQREQGLTGKGDSIISFQGEYISPEIKKEAEELKLEIPHYFQHMLHIVVEHKGMGVREAECRRRLLASGMTDVLGDGFRRMDNKVFYKDAQLCVSSLRCTERAALIHFGFFIYALKADIPLLGLDHFDLSPKSFSLAVMRGYCDEDAEINKAS